MVNVVLPVAAEIGPRWISGASPHHQQFVADPDQVDPMLPGAMVLKPLSVGTGDRRQCQNEKK
jgi:hypothetical protein